jgi:hypothetical protein
MGILRKLQNWSITSIFDEYRRFAGGKIRLADQEFIELFDMKTLWLAMGQAEQQDDGVIRPAWSKRLLLLS